MKKHIIVSLLSILMFASCKDMDYDLQQSVFIEDPVYPGLPEYSEWGYNTFGAYIDRKPFTSNNRDLPAKIIVNDDTLNLQLAGTMGGESMNMKFSFIGYPVPDYDGLTELNGQTFDLTSEQCIVSLTRNGIVETLDVFEGTFAVQSVQNLVVDGELIKSILSGRFSFKTFINREPTAIANGRFDLGIGYDSFYNFRRRIIFD